MAMKKKLSTEKQPRKPLPRNYRPKDSSPYKVQDKDTWINVAARNNVDPQALIRFNFNTNDPGEVNWYLRENTGCNVHTEDEKNWMFSTSADPGYIHLPMKTLDMSPITVTGKKTVSPLAAEFEGPSSPLGTIGQVFDGFQMLDIALTIAGVEAGAVVMLGISIVTAPIAPFVALGGAHEAALNELRKQQILAGLTRGIVMTADGRSPRYIDSLGFVMKSPVRNFVYPEFGVQLQGIYNTSLIAGIVHGRQFNTVATQNLFDFIHARMTDSSKAEYTRYETEDYADPRQAPENWPLRKWYDYYRLCAKIYEPKIMLR